MDLPIYVNCRDRVTHLRSLVAWLERAGHERIILLDNASTYEPLLDYYAATPHEVRRLGRNSGSRSLWNEGIVPSETFVYTDPDLVPTEECPLDMVERLAGLLERYDAPKVALGLYLDDLPATLSLGIVEWERSLVSKSREIEPGVFNSLADTTFAVYRAGATFSFDALRTGFPYQARHMSWYVAEPGAEDRYYLEHATAGPMGSSWKESFL